MFAREVWSRWLFFAAEIGELGVREGFVWVESDYLAGSDSRGYRFVVRGVGTFGFVSVDRLHFT